MPLLHVCTEIGKLIRIKKKIKMERTQASKSIDIYVGKYIQMREQAQPHTQTHTHVLLLNMHLLKQSMNVYI